MDVEMCFFNGYTTMVLTQQKTMEIIHKNPWKLLDNIDGDMIM